MNGYNALIKRVSTIRNPMAVNTPTLKKMSEALGGPTTPEQRQLLRDLQGFIAYGIREGLSFDVILGMLRHDISGLIDKEQGFLPRVKGMASELEMVARDPEIQRELREIESEFSGSKPKKR
jgi:hypothetical protein